MTDTEETDEEMEPRPMKWTALAGAVAQFVANVGRSVTALAEDVSTMLAHETRYRWDRDGAYERMQREIEMLPTVRE